MKTAKQAYDRALSRMAPHERGISKSISRFGLDKQGGGGILIGGIHSAAQDMALRKVARKDLGKAVPEPVSKPRVPKATEEA